MSILTTFEEKQTYCNYNGTLDTSKHDLYVPIILNKKCIYICGSPYTPAFSCSLITRTTKVMSGIHTALSITKTCRRSPKRIVIIMTRKLL